jgi:hypothetical protein
MLSPQPRATRSSRKSEPRWVHIATVLRERILNEPNQDEGSLSDIALANEFKASPRSFAKPSRGWSMKDC